MLPGPAARPNADNPPKKEPAEPGPNEVVLGEADQKPTLVPETGGHQARVLGAWFLNEIR